MGIGKDKMTYDPTDANSLAASDTIGAYTLDGSGTRITSTLNSGKQSLDVNVTSAINVNVDGFYDVTNNPVPDSVDTIVYNRAATPGVTDALVRATGASPTADAIVAANIHGQDVNSVMLGFNGTTFDRVTSTSSALDINLKTSAATVTVSDAALANTALKSSKKSVTTTAAAILASQLSARKYLTFQNLGSAAIFVGDATVDATTGLRLSNGAMLEGLRIGPALSVFALTSAGTGDVRILEAS